MLDAALPSSALDRPNAAAREETLDPCTGTVFNAITQAAALVLPAKRNN